MTIQITSLLQRIAAPAFVAAAAALSGCAIAPSTPASLTPATVEAGTRHAQTVSVAVSGVSAHATAQRHLSDDTVAEAISAAIEKNKTFSQVIKGGTGNLRLSVALLSADYPAMGLNFTVKNEMIWELKRADGTSVWKEAIKSEGLATTSEAFAGVERIRLAAERAVSNNIAQGLGKIAKLKL
jgi:hypothetical protein